jgi:hypothetical protein
MCSPGYPPANNGCAGLGLTHTHPPNPHVSRTRLSTPDLHSQERETRMATAVERILVNSDCAQPPMGTSPWLVTDAVSEVAGPLGSNPAERTCVVAQKCFWSKSGFRRPSGGLGGASNKQRQHMRAPVPAVCLGCLDLHVLCYHLHISPPGGPRKAPASPTWKCDGEPPRT